jgi:cytochrome c
MGRADGLARWAFFAGSLLLAGSAGGGRALADEAQARRSGCLECHSPDRAKIGPAFHEVAARYKGDPRARATLIEKVKRGGKGNWTKVSGGAPMPPHGRRLSDAEIQGLVDWVLSL